MLMEEATRTNEGGWAENTAFMQLGTGNRLSDGGNHSAALTTSAASRNYPHPLLRFTPPSFSTLSRPFYPFVLILRNPSRNCARSPVTVSHNKITSVFVDFTDPDNRESSLILFGSTTVIIFPVLMMLNS